jgi:hypothetical protein
VVSSPDEPYVGPPLLKLSRNFVFDEDLDQLEAGDDDLDLLGCVVFCGRAERHLTDVGGYV